MTDSNPEPDAITPEGMEILDAWLRSRTHAGDSTAIDVAVLVRYHSGVLATAEINAVETALARSGAARALLRTTRTELQRLRALPWRDVAQLRGESSAAGEIAREWISVTLEETRSAGALGRSWTAWDAVREGVSSGAEAGLRSARAAWTVLSAFGDQLRYITMAAPAAMARSGADPEVGFGETYPAGISGTLFAEIDAEESLNAELRILGAAGQPAAALDGATLHLSLSIHGLTVPLAAASVSGGRAVWSLPGAGRAIGMNIGPLHSGMFRITLNEGEPGSAEEHARIMAPILAEDGSVASRIPVSIEIQDGPRWEDGTLRAAISIEPEVLFAYRDYRLRLDLAITRTAAQCLGIWPLSTWTNGALVVTAECEGGPQEGALPGAVLRAWLIK